MDTDQEIIPEPFNIINKPQLGLEKDSLRISDRDRYDVLDYELKELITRSHTDKTGPVTIEAKFEVLDRVKKMSSAEVEEYLDEKRRILRERELDEEEERRKASWGGRRARIEWSEPRDRD